MASDSKPWNGRRPKNDLHGSTGGDAAAARVMGVRNVVQGDLMAIPDRIDDASQDMVATFDEVEHFAKSELVELFKEVRRVLKPAGRWIIHTPDGESPTVGRVRCCFISLWKPAL